METVALVVKPVLPVIARTVSELLTVIGLVYFAELVVGRFPAVV